MLIFIQMQFNERLYFKNLQDIKLGKKIIQYSIILIDEIGFEVFIFKKLVEWIKFIEVFVYCYFENKYCLLVYLFCWYWEWMKFSIDYNIMNIEDLK